MPVSILYDWGDGGLLIGSSDDPRLLLQVAQNLLARARDEADLSRWVDPVKAALDKAEVERLERVLGLLVGSEVLDAQA